MESETLKIFDRHHKHIGETSREDVHTSGHWHETFHCWFVSQEDDTDYIYLQIRSDMKKDYPNMLDTTVAGHLLAHEALSDGTREIREELGLHVPFTDLISLGIIEDRIIHEDFIDYEFVNVFLYRKSYPLLEAPKLQKEEVSGIVKTPFSHFYDLWLGRTDEIKVEGFTMDASNKKQFINQSVNKASFVPHERSYYETSVSRIKAHI